MNKKETIEHVKLLKENGLNYAKIADDLNSRGVKNHYYPDVEGSRWSQSVVSRFMCDNGYRLIPKHKRGTRRKKRKMKKSNVQHVSKQTQTSADEFGIIKEIWKSNLSKDTKKYVIGNLI